MGGWQFIQPMKTSPTSARVGDAMRAATLPGGIYKTADGGKSWTPKTQGLGQVITDPKNKNLISNYAAIALSQSDPAASDVHLRWLVVAGDHL